MPVHGARAFVVAGGRAGREKWKKRLSIWSVVWHFQCNRRSHSMENPYQAPKAEITVPSQGSLPLTWKQILFSFTGRIPRRQFWAGLGIAFLVIFGLGGVLFFAVYSSPSAAPGGGGGGSSAITVFGVIPVLGVEIVLMWMLLAIQAKRWHDMNYSAWMILLNFIPFVSLVTLFVCGCVRGTTGANRFGEDPT
jgi:uncharacterized membrane protein YhaH (DUF805 family)